MTKQTEPIENKNNKYLDIERSRELFKLGAFKTRAWQVGDWVCLKHSDRIFLVTKIDNEANHIARIGVHDPVGSVSAIGRSSGFLLPTLDDVLGEIKAQGFYYEVSLERFAHRVCLWGQEDWKDKYDTRGDSDLLAAYECLRKVLSAKKGVEK